MNPARRHLTILIIMLLAIGSGLFLYKHFTLDVPLSESETVNSWTVEANLRFLAEKGTPVKASFTIPYMPPLFATLDEYFVAHNYGVITNLKGNNRETVWSIRRAKGLQSLYYRAIFRQTDSQESPLTAPPPVKIMELADSQKSAVEALTAQIRKKSADIQTFAQATIKTLQQNKDGNVKILVGSQPTDDKIITAAIMILNQANIAAMPVKGLVLHQQSKVDFKTILAVYNDKDWVFINAKTASSGLAKNVLIWQYGDSPIYAVKGGKKAQFTLSISKTPINALNVAKLRGTQTDSQLIKFSLLQLPVNVQQTYKVLLTIPLGAFVILILRNFVGLLTFGTFMPVLIALAFRETHIAWGITLFTIIVSFGLLVRLYLDQLRLLLVPRLAAILTVVIMLMIFISIISQHLGLESGLSVALFPMVILTMTIERMCITWDERGGYEAILAGVGSLTAATIAYGVMSNSTLEYLLFAFPELLLVLMAFILWFGQYRGYRLTELIRFKVLAKHV
jgi:7 transmembrane helices usually fused to an inactive transglutaminase/Inactive transglutaminase fused to 7 transmembrane helices